MNKTTQFLLTATFMLSAVHVNGQRDYNISSTDNDHRWWLIAGGWDIKIKKRFANFDENEKMHGQQLVMKGKDTTHLFNHHHGKLTDIKSYIDGHVYREYNFRFKNYDFKGYNLDGEMREEIKHSDSRHFTRTRYFAGSPFENNAAPNQIEYEASFFHDCRYCDPPPSWVDTTAADYIPFISDEFGNKGILHGDWKRYYENGQLRKTGTMLYGEKHGEWIEYKEDGSLVQKSYWFDGEQLANKNAFETKEQYSEKEYYHVMNRRWDAQQNQTIDFER